MTLWSPENWKWKTGKMEMLEKVKNMKKSKIHYRTAISYIKALESMKAEWQRESPKCNK